MNPLSEFKRFFREGSSLTRLILVNLVVFLFLKILGVIFFLFKQENLEQIVLNFLALPADPEVLLRKPWTVLTYMFLHYDFFHILFNLLWLYWFGKIFLQYLNAKKLYAVYLLGGLTGGLIYILAYNLFPAFAEARHMSVALGASAAVLAIVMAISFYVPNYTMYLIFLGPVKLKYIAIVTIILDILSIKSGNAGGHLAHIGGALFGIVYASQLSRGKDLSKGFNSLMDNIFTRFKSRGGMKVKYKKSVRTETDMDYNARKAEEQKEIDHILDKISKGGYEALTREEKETLFRSSK